MVPPDQGSVVAETLAVKADAVLKSPRERAK
jgi:hypothetical protein